MKKLITVVSLCVAASSSFADDFTTVGAVCTAGAGTAIGASVATNFVKTSFTPKCSANTSVGFVQNSNAAGVGAISTKGNQVFGGHTNGGAVAKTADCTTCAAAQATGAATTALAAAGGST
jgi:hypothetical protein